MTQAIVSAEPKPVTDYTPPEGGWASDGNEDIPPAFPIVSIVQPMTQLKNAIPGWFYASDTEECTSDFDCVPLVRRETRALFVEGDDKPWCRSDDGRVPAPRQKLWNLEAGSRITVGKDSHGVPPIAPKDCANCVFSDWGDGAPPMCGNAYAIIAARNGDPDDLVQLRIKGTSIRPFRQWVSRKLAPKRLPMFFFQLHLTTEEHTEPGRKWHQMVIESSPLNEADARIYNDVISAHRARIETAVRETGAEVDAWEDPADLAFE